MKDHDDIYQLIAATSVALKKCIKPNVKYLDCIQFAQSSSTGITDTESAKTLMKEIIRRYG